MSLKYLSRVSALTVLALSVVACGSDNSSNYLPPLTEQTEADRIAAAEKAEADRIAAAEKAEADRIAAAEKAEADRIAAAEKDLEDAVAKAVEKALAEKEKAAADKIAAEKARLQKIEANRIVLLNKAIEAGVGIWKATDYAEAMKEASAVEAKKALDIILAQTELDQAKGVADANERYPIGEVSGGLTGTSSTSVNNQFTYLHEVVYNQPYSIVLGKYESIQNGYDTPTTVNGDVRYRESSDITIKGLETKADAIPSLGTAKYSGKAFSRDGNFHQTNNIYKEGLLSYDVNFKDRTGVGAIANLGDTVDLQQGTISGSGITSIAKQASNEGTYSLNFFGKKAEEIAGKVVFDGIDTIGFGGTRGEVSK